MKNTLLACIACLICVTLPARQLPAHPRVAVVMSGGGAKGFAHIGALKVIEKAGIPVDIITGTSMGCLIGGLYSIGYNANLLDTLVRQQDWSFLLSDKVDVSNESLYDRKKENIYAFSRDVRFVKKEEQIMGLMEGKNLSKLFNKLTTDYPDSIDFNTLPIPFACVATNIIDNTEYVFHQGVLAEAMRASMAIPGVFSPLRKGSMILVDGGLRNNYPVDIARQMGADIVIGITVQSPLKTADDITNGASVLSQIVDINCRDKYDANVKNTDILIQVNTEGYGTSSFSEASVDTLIRRGEEAAMKQWQKLVDLKEKLGLSAITRPQHPKPTSWEHLTQKMKLAEVSFEHVEQADQRFIARQYRLDNRDSIRVSDADKIANTMRVDLFYNDADCYLTQQANGHCLHIVAKGKKSTKINLGIRFDTEEKMALQANMAFFVRSNTAPMTSDLTLRLGKRSMARVDFAIHPYLWGTINASYIYRYQDLNVYNQASREYNITYDQHTVNLTPFDFNIRNFNFKIGAQFDYYHIQNILQDVSIQALESWPRNQHLFTYRADVEYNSEDQWYFASRGARFRANYAYHTDNLIGYDGHLGLNVVSALWRMSFPLNNRLTFQPILYGRLILDDNPPYTLQNLIGGQWDQYYLPDQHMPFAGIGNIERVENKFVSASIKLQQRIFNNNYILGNLSAYQTADHFGDMFALGPKIGCEMAYYYNSILGPLGASVGWSSKTKTVNFYINLGFVF